MAAPLKSSPSTIRVPDAEPLRRPGSEPPRGKAPAKTQYVLGEGLFKDALVRERRRAERFGRSFAVLLIDGGSRATIGWGAWAPILRALTAVKREIDLVGWLERGSVMGLLVTEIDHVKGAHKVSQRVRRELSRRIHRSRVEALSIRLYGGGQAAKGTDGIPPVDSWLDALAERRRPWWQEAPKRALDILGAASLLTLLSPVFAFIALAVKATSPGPAFFRQTRVGRRAEPFTMLKFRTMFVNMDNQIHQAYMTWFIQSSGTQARTGDETYKIAHDPRVTPLGRFLRRTSLDELPQFWNVLRGDMSLVGPRPPLPFEVEKYQPWHRRRVLDAKPGITGLWQVTGRSRTTFDEMVRLDLRYARTRTFWTDLRILAATPRAVISGKGAM